MKQEFSKPWVDPYPEATAALRDLDAWMREHHPDALTCDEEYGFLPIASLVNSGTVSASWLYLYEWMTSKEKK